jgi:hypothetical protein
VRVGLRQRGLAALAVLGLATTACGKPKAPPPPAAEPPVATPVAAPRNATREAQEELTREVLAFTVTDHHVDAIEAVDWDLRGFWADPKEAWKVRGKVAFADIVAAAEATPPVREALSKRGISARDYVLGTFAMLGAYGYESARMADAKSVAGKRPPVNEETLAVLRHRFDAVRRIVTQKPAEPKRS